MIVVRVLMDVQEQLKNEFISQMKEDREASLQYDGCLHFDLYQDTQKDNGFILYEEWESIEHFDNFRTSDGFKARGSVIFPMIAGKPDSLYFTGEKLQ